MDLNFCIKDDYLHLILVKGTQMLLKAFLKMLMQPNS